jgi:GPH family glycoside/pentoside/hexuronide:cation symporter
MGMIFAGIAAVTMLLSVFGIKENKESLKVEPLGLISGVKETFKNKPFLIYVSSMLMTESCKVIGLAVIPFYAKYVLRMDLAQTIMTGVIFGAAILFTPVAVLINKHAGTKRTYMSCLLALAAGFFTLTFTSSILIACIAGIVVGYGALASVTISNILIAQVIDYDQLTTHRRREGMYYGINALILRLSVAIQSIIVTGVLNYSGYDSTKAIQSSQAVTGIQILMGIVPMVLAL